MKPRPVATVEVGGERIVFVDTKNKAPQEFYINSDDLEAHWVRQGVWGMFQCVRGSSQTTPQG